MSDLHNQVIEAIRALPRPITREQAMEAADLIQDQKTKQQFKAWMDSNGAQLVHMINEGK